MDHEQMKGAVEAILFTMGGAVEAGRIAAALDIEHQEVTELLLEMMQEYEQSQRGIRIIRLEESYQMCTKKEYYDILIKIARTPKKISLTDVLIETLAIIAYKQPITKMEIEKIRGVKSDHAVNRLVEYGLVHELGRLDAPGRPILFGTTEEFLRHFGISQPEDLPRPPQEQIDEFKAEAETEVNEKINI